MQADLQERLDAAARPVHEVSHPDIIGLWRRGVARRWRRRAFTGSSIAGVVVGTAVVVSQLAAPSTIHAPFIGQDSVPNQASEPGEKGTGEPVATPHVDPFLAGQPLHCSGIHARRPADTDRRLRDLGYRPVWRFMDGSNVPYPDDYAPDNAVIFDASVQPDGTLYLFAVPDDHPDASEAARYDQGC